MKQDHRQAICTIISNMLDNPDESGIYPTGRCFDELERYIEEQIEGAKIAGLGQQRATSGRQTETLSTALLDVLQSMKSGTEITFSISPSNPVMIVAVEQHRTFGISCAFTIDSIEECNGDIIIKTWLEEVAKRTVFKA